MAEADDRLFNEVNRCAKELTAIRILLTQAVNFATNAESEIPEKMRRFANYFHDVHDMIYAYENSGQQKPEHLNRELERCDDRFRQLLEGLHADGGTFEKVRREMAADPNNRYDHTRLIDKPNGGA